MNYLDQMPYDHLFAETNNVLYDIGFTEKFEVFGATVWETRDFFATDYLILKLKELGWKDARKPSSMYLLEHPNGCLANIKSRVDSNGYRSMTFFRMKDRW